MGAEGGPEGVERAGLGGDDARLWEEFREPVEARGRTASSGQELKGKPDMLPIVSHPALQPKGPLGGSGARLRAKNQGICSARFEGRPIRPTRWARRAVVTQIG